MRQRKKGRTRLFRWGDKYDKKYKRIKGALNALKWIIN
jgi:hypothetical protein